MVEFKKDDEGFTIDIKVTRYIVDVDKKGIFNLLRREVNSAESKGLFSTKKEAIESVLKQLEEITND